MSNDNIKSSDLKDVAGGKKSPPKKGNQISQGGALGQGGSLDSGDVQNIAGGGTGDHISQPGADRKQRVGGSQISGQNVAEHIVGGSKADRSEDKQPSRNKPLSSADVAEHIVGGSKTDRSEDKQRTRSKPLSSADVAEHIVGGAGTNRRGDSGLKPGNQLKASDVQNIAGGAKSSAAETLRGRKKNDGPAPS